MTDCKEKLKTPKNLLATFLLNICDLCEYILPHFIQVT